MPNVSWHFQNLWVKPPYSFTPRGIDYLKSRIQNGGPEVVEVNKYQFVLHIETSI